MRPLNVRTYTDYTTVYNSIQLLLWLFSGSYTVTSDAYLPSGATLGPDSVKLSVPVSTAIELNPMTGEPQGTVQYVAATEASPRGAGDATAQYALVVQTATGALQLVTAGGDITKEGDMVSVDYTGATDT